MKPPHSSAFSSCFAHSSSSAFFHPTAPWQKCPLTRPRFTVTVHHSIRTFCPVALASGAEEEIFIRRHAAPQKPSNSQPPPSDPHSDDQFDFVNDSAAHSATAISQPSSDVVEGAPEIRVQTSPNQSDSRQTPLDEHSSPPNAPRASELNEHAPLRVLIPSDMHDIAEKVRQETSRLFTESRLLPGVRMPTTRDAVLFAWDLALIVSVLLLLRAGVSQVLRWIHNRLNATRGKKSNIPYEQSVFECMQRPLEFLSLFTVGTALAEVVSRPLAATGLLRHIRTLRELGMIISATWFLLKWIDRIRSRFAVDKRIDNAQVDATSRIATVATFVASMLIALDTIGINVQTVLAFGGIGGVAIGFAGREIISNFFGGFMIYVTRPFSVGEWIRSIEERELNGTVEDIGWYLTRVRTWDKRPLYIPNSRFSTLIVENGSRMDNRRILHTIHVRHEDMPVVPTIIAAMEQLLMTHQELDPRQHRLAYVDSFGEYSIRLWLSCYTKSVFLYDYRRVQQDILIKCYDIIRSNGAKLATINTRDMRSGIDTDRYGPLGTKATFGQAIPSVPEGLQRQEYVNTDVPGSPQYEKTTPMVRFNTIESGIDFSQVPQTPAAPNGVPAGASVSHNSPPPPTGSSIPTDDQLTGANRDSSSQRSASVAAVAAAAAALAAANKNRSRSNDEAETQTRPGEAKDPPDSSRAEAPAASGGAPQGEMRITAAKPTRNIQSPSSGMTSSGHRNPPPATKVAGTKSGDDAQNTNTSASVTSKTDANSVSSKSATNGQAAAPSGGVMKISKARTQPSAADIDSRESSERLKGREQPHPDGADNVSSSAMTEQRNGAPQEMKITGTKSSRGSGSSTGASSSSISTTGRPKNAASSVNDDNDQTATQKAAALRHQNPTSTNASSGGGEMKISKARKPVQISQGNGEDAKAQEGTNQQSAGSENEKRADREER